MYIYAVKLILVITLEYWRYDTHLLPITPNLTRRYGHAPGHVLRAGGAPTPLYCLGLALGASLRPSTALCNPRRTPVYRQCRMSCWCWCHLRTGSSVVIVVFGVAGPRRPSSLGRVSRYGCIVGRGRPGEWLTEFLETASFACFPSLPSHLVRRRPAPSE